MVKAKDLKLLRKKIEKADRMDKSTIQKCIFGSTSVKNDGSSSDNNDNHDYTIECFTSADILGCSSTAVSTTKELLNLFEENMGDLYRQSSWGLDLDEKSQEFEHRKARFLIVRKQRQQRQQGQDDGELCNNDENSTTTTTTTTTASSSSSLVAYCHYRFCLDDDEQPTSAVLYVYELQVASSERRRGWGKRLMQMMEQLARAADMPKVVLTVFKTNAPALQFYRETLQYDIDATSPSQYQERADYEILSKTMVP
jgi:N-alpha-acetyltransferase 40